MDITWNCSNCGNENDATAISCQSCSQPKDKPIEDNINAFEANDATANFESTAPYDPNDPNGAYESNTAYDPNAPYDSNAPYDGSTSYAYDQNASYDPSDPNAVYDPNNASYDPNADYDPNDANANYDPYANYDQNAYDPNSIFNPDAIYDPYENNENSLEVGSVASSSDPYNTTKVIKKKKEKYKVCQSCFHKHYEGVFCHMYMEEFDEEDEENEIDNQQSVSEFGSSEEGSVTRYTNMLQRQPIKGTELNKPLETPYYVKKIKYMRCNCDVGIPIGNERYVQLPNPLIIGDIKILTYDRIKEFKDKKELSEVQLQLIHKDLLYNISNLIPYILSFLELGQCNNTAITCHAWYDGVQQYVEYKDVRDMIPWTVLKPHIGQVDTVLLLGNKLFTGGDRRIYCTDIYTGNFSNNTTVIVLYYD
jgi:hypothetical protein